MAVGNVVLAAAMAVLWRRSSGKGQQIASACGAWALAYAVFAVAGALRIHTEGAAPAAEAAAAALVAVAAVLFLKGNFVLARRQLGWRALLAVGGVLLAVVAAAHWTSDRLERIVLAGGVGATIGWSGAVLYRHVEGGRLVGVLVLLRSLNVMLYPLFFELGLVDPSLLVSFLLNLWVGFGLICLALLRESAEAERARGEAQALNDELRRESERARASEARFRDFANSASDWLWETDAEGRYSYMSPNYAAVSGRDPAALQGLRRADFLREIVQSPRDELNLHLAETEARQPFRERRLWVGEMSGARCISVSGAPVFGPDGAFAGYRGVARDETDAAHAAAERDNLALIVASSEDAIIGMSADAVIRSWNAGAEAVYGWSAAEAVGRSVGIVAPAGERAETLARVARACGGETIGPFLARRARKDGEELVLSITLFPVRDPKGQVLGAAGIGRNMTRLLETEQALRQSETRFRDYASAASDWFWELDAEQRYAYVSPNFTTVMGVSTESRIGREWPAEPPTGDPEGRWRVLKATMDERRAVRDFILPHADGAGRLRRLRVNAIPFFDEAGRFAGYRGASRDVTAEIESALAAQRLEAALENLPQGAALYDAEDRLVFANGAYRARLDAVAHALRPGVTFEAYLRAAVAAGELEEAAGREEEWIAERLARRAASSGPFELRRRGGRTLIVVENRLPGGGVFVFTTDVTEVRRREDRLRQAQRLEALGRLTGGVAHDFNNLLTVVAGNLELALDADLPAGARPMLQAGQRAAARGAGLTRRLLAFARQQPLEARPTDVNAVLRGMLELVSRTIGAAIEVGADFEEGLPLAQVDPGQLEGAVLNLALNARDAMPLGGRLVVRTCAGVGADAGFVAVSVADTGVGMAPDVAARVFEPFFTTKGEGKGTGLGLSMVYGFATQSGGRIELATAPGEGARFTLLLPRTASHVGAEAAPTPSPPGSGAVLLVEDDADVRELCRLMLTSLGYGVCAEADADAALGRLRSGEPFAALLSDAMLPGAISGPELLRRAREGRPGLRVLLMSGYVEDDAVLPAEVTLLRKPFDRAAMAEAMRAALQAA